MNFFSLEQGKIVLKTDKSAPVPATELVWCDLLNPTKEQEKELEWQFGIEIPTRDEMHEIELSSRLYVENGAAYCTTSVMTQMETPEPEIHAVTFILKGNTLITLRYSEPYSFKNFINRLPHIEPSPVSGTTVLMGLFEAIVNRLADMLELSNRQLDELNDRLFRPSIQDKKQREQSMPDFEDLLRQIGIQGDLLSKIRESLLSITRGLGFISTTHYCPPTSEVHTKSHILLKDIAALNDQAGFLSNKVSFLLDASLGLVGIQQTQIIKIFSVAAVVFLPPTLVASMYGMNFDFMPELHWKIGYPFAILLMFVSAWLPYQFFKKKKWL